MWLRFRLRLLAICCVCAHVNAMGDVSDDQTFVDILVSDYFKTEQNLWTMIENRADNVLLHVYKTHENFYNRTICESASGIFMRDILLTGDPVVAVAVSLNATAELGYNHLREQELDRQTITDYANYSLKILKDASDFIELTMQKSFWEYLLIVRMALRVCVLFFPQLLLLLFFFLMSFRISTNAVVAAKRFKHRTKSSTISIETFSLAC